MRKLTIALLLAMLTLGGCTLQKPDEASLPFASNDRRSYEAAAGDAEIERLFRKEMTRRELDGGNNVHLYSYNAQTLVIGETSSEIAHQAVIGLARVIPGVKQVHDYLRVGPVSNAAARKQDEQLRLALRTALGRMPKIKDFYPSHVGVVTAQGTVYLYGLVRRHEADAVLATVRSSPGVKEVVKVFTYMPR